MEEVLDKFWQYISVHVDWFDEKLKDIHKKVGTKDTIENHNQVEQFKEMLISHRDKKFKEELAKVMEEVGIMGEKEKEEQWYFNCDIFQSCTQFNQLWFNG